MKIEINNLVSITEANQNFSKIAKIVDNNGTAVIFKNNKPRYILVDYNLINEESELNFADNDELDTVAVNILKKYKKTFEELAKKNIIKKDKKRGE